KQLQTDARAARLACFRSGSGSRRHHNLVRWDKTYADESVEGHRPVQARRPRGAHRATRPADDADHNHVRPAPGYELPDRGNDECAGASKGFASSLVEWEVSFRFRSTLLEWRIVPEVLALTSQRLPK